MSIMVLLLHKESKNEQDRTLTLLRLRFIYLFSLICWCSAGFWWHISLFCGHDSNWHPSSFQSVKQGNRQNRTHVTATPECFPSRQCQSVHSEFRFLFHSLLHWQGYFSFVISMVWSAVTKRDRGWVNRTLPLLFFVCDLIVPCGSSKWCQVNLICKNVIISDTELISIFWCAKPI